MVIIDKEGHTHDLCGYSNCFRPAVAMCGFIPVCEFHLHHPEKWGKDGMTFTGSRFVKKGD